MLRHCLVPRRWVVLAAVLLVAAAGCTTREASFTNAPLPLVNSSPVPQPGENIEALVVTISNDHFDKTVYEQDPGATRLIIHTQGGPYLFSIDGLVDRRELPADGESVILYSVSDPGRHTMHANLSTSTNPSAEQATAVLDVRPPGGR